MGSGKAQCEVCRARPATGLFLCGVCSRSWDRDTIQNGGSVAASLVWVARRAWYFARAQKRRVAELERALKEEKERSARLAELHYELAVCYNGNHDVKDGVCVVDGGAKPRAELKTCPHGDVFHGRGDGCPSCQRGEARPSPTCGCTCHVGYDPTPMECGECCADPCNQCGGKGWSWIGCKLCGGKGRKLVATGNTNDGG
jgi:hypothetical protein